MYDPLTLLMEARRQDLLREAERARLVHQVRLARRKRASPVYRTVLVIVGRRLTHWGEQLQVRYGETAYTLSATGTGIE